MEALGPPSAAQVTILVEGAPHRVAAGQNLLAACLSLGFEIPYFCWHPALHSVGACRQCAVKVFRDEHDAAGTIVMSCETPVAEGLRVSIVDAEARAFRAAVSEWLMAGHPHDCPVCDEGGECHLQDMTVLTGHVRRRYRFDKRTHRSQDLGPFVNHEMNRCIQCFRCVRFYRDFAGGTDLEVFGAHRNLFFGRHRDGALASGLAGNLVEICPTGVFTDKTFKARYVRPWDLATAPSVCPHCGVGCATIVGARGGVLRRVRARYHGEVNGFFLCDRGRFGNEFVNDARRVRRPLLRAGRGAEAVAAAPAAVEAWLRARLHFGAKVIGIGSPRASLEANYALRRLVGPERFFAGVAAREHGLVALAARILRRGHARAPTLREVARADAALVLGEDFAQTAPLLALALRQCALQAPLEEAVRSGIPPWRSEPLRRFIQRRRGPLFVASPAATGLDDAAAAAHRAAPDEIARLAAAVAREIDPGAAAVAGLAGEAQALATRIGRELREAARPLVVCGCAGGSEATLLAAEAICAALARAGRAPSLAIAVPECDSLGLALLGPRPLDEAFLEAGRGGIDTLVVLENDLFRRADRARVAALLAAAANVVAIDHTLHATAEASDLVLPAATFVECAGTFVSAEGRAQRFFAAMPAPAEARESRLWVEQMMAVSGEGVPWRSGDELRATLEDEFPKMRGVVACAPPAGARWLGRKIPREGHRSSGRTALGPEHEMHEPRPPEDPESPLAFSMEGYTGTPPPALVARAWTPGWNSVQAAITQQEVPGGALRGGDPGVRLIEPPSRPEPPAPCAPPDPFTPRDGQWQLVPLPHIFGSGELSALSQGIALLAPRPALLANPGDLRAAGLAEGEEVEAEVAGARLRLPVQAEASLPAGVAGVPIDVPGMPWLDLPGWARIRKATP